MLKKGMGMNGLVSSSGSQMVSKVVGESQVSKARALRGLAGAASLIAIAAPAAAQVQPASPSSIDAAANSDTATPAEIVVTAQKRTERLQDIPLAVSVVGGEQLGLISRPSVESAVQLVPALNVLKASNTLNQTIFLRGVGTTNFSIAAEPSVSVVVDGVVYARAGEAFGDLVDIDRLEVLRGPQGTLFGKNASAGVLNIVTKMPEFEQFGGNVEASAFSHHGEYRFKAAVNAPLAANAAARITGFYSNYDGNIRNITTNQWVNGYEHYGVRAQLLVEPSASLRLYAAADYRKGNDDCCGSVISVGPIDPATGAPSTSPVASVIPTPLGANSRTIAENLATETREKSYGVSLQADLTLGDHTVTSITAYRKYDNFEVRDGDALPGPYVGFAQLHDFGPTRTHTFTQEIRLTSPADKLLSYVLGGYYSNAFSSRSQLRNVINCNAVAGAPTTVAIPCGSALAQPSTMPVSTVDLGSRLKNLAAFGQFTLSLSNSFRLIGGLRYVHDELSGFHKRTSVGLATNASGLPVTVNGILGNFDQGVYDRYLTLVASGQNPNTAATNAVTASNGVFYRANASNDNLSGKAAIQVDLSRDHMFYGSYTRGYKGPAYNIFFNLTGTATNLIEPETSDAFELGLKNTLLQGRMTLNLALFRADYHNFQANNPEIVAGFSIVRFTNAGEVSTKGVELDLTWRPVADLTINGGVAYTKAVVDRFNAPPGAAATAIIPDGTSLQFAPKWKGSLNANYRVRTGGALDVWLGSSMNFQSKQLSIFSSDPVQRQFGTIPAYALINAQIGVGDPADRVRVTFQVRNITDKSYPASIGPSLSQRYYRYLIPRDADRYYGVTARLNF